MTGSMLIDGMMAFFTLVLLGAIVVPIYLFVPKWLAEERVRRIAFHAAAIDAIGVELARSQVDHGQRARLADQRQRNVAALLSLEPGHTVPPMSANSVRDAGVAA